MTIASENLLYEFAATGIMGIDFVLKGNIPYLMEVNPRFPGTFELAENVLEINLLQLHFAGCQKILPQDLVLSCKKYGIKHIIFSDGDYILPDLSKIQGICDISYPNTKVTKGTPICSILTYGSNPIEAKKFASKQIKKVYSNIK